MPNKHLVDRREEKVVETANPVKKSSPVRVVPQNTSQKYLIEGLLGDQDGELAHLECDGFTRVAHYLLQQHGVHHHCFHGSCTVGETVVPTHFWIVAGKYTVDYRLRTWVGNNAPHGVFDHKLFPDVQYVGQEILMNVSAVIFEILTQR
jgi:hypothetical protein